jgi:2-methylcitrate dehydratase PrpD
VISAQASLGYSLGVRLVKGSNDLELYVDPGMWRNPEVLAIADKLEPYFLNVPEHPRMTRVEITLRGGRKLEGEQVDARGSETLPFDQQVIDEKFRRLAAFCIPEDRATQIMRQVAGLEQLASMRRITALLA